MKKLNVYPVIQAVLAATLFGASAPVAKLFLGEIQPVVLASFLYLGSGMGLLLFREFRRMKSNFAMIEADISKSDVPWLAGAIIAGGVAAPVMLMFGLRGTPAATASLLLNFEGVTTTLIACFVFRESVGGRVWWAIAFITVACVLLSWNINGEWGFSAGTAGVLGACVFWGIDNNFTRYISAKDPLSIVTIKGLCAGSFSLVLALLMHNYFPGYKIVLGALLLGFFSYGLSMVMFIFAMRGLGAARTSAFFGTAPFIGALLSFLFFKEAPSVLFFVSFLLMVTGASLLLYEEHCHLHLHDNIEHEHSHRHDDEHHMYHHPEGEFPVSVIHSHRHIHEDIEHSHPHTPDIHHWHAH